MATRTGKGAKASRKTGARAARGVPARGRRSRKGPRRGSLRITREPSDARSPVEGYAEALGGGF